ncbi:MAG: tetratricopeptide repeat protein [Pikeienuella sp.]|uniref:tetratricopeptide repeat protein n=1 Tax=Pikeienuella sp. TaxID=2831957 RepID=UPI00391B6153
MTRPLAAFALLFALSACAPQPPGAASAEPPEEIGLRLLAQDQPEMALRAFNRAIAAANGPVARAEAMTGAGVAMIRLGRMTEAARMLEAAIALAPDAPGAPVTLNALGVASYAAGRPEEALAAFRRAEALVSGEDPAIRANIALAEAVLEEASADVELDEFDYDVIQYGHGVWRLAPRRAAAPEERRP